MKLVQFICIPIIAHAISNGANEPIADNELGLITKDCALQYCESLDALGLWMTFVSECDTRSPILVAHGNKHTSDPVARHDANSCALYLCPTLANHATEYLQAGCKSTFKLFIKNQKAAN